MKITLKVIAQETGVSQMTVSRILRGKVPGQVSGELRERVAAALVKYGYDFQKPARRGEQPELHEKKIICPIPYPEFLKNPPPDNNLVFYHELDTFCRKNRLRHEYLPGLTKNDPMVPEWENLRKLSPGTPVLFHSAYELTSAIALQQQGCRVALVMRDLFWRDFYAPQLKKMSCFTIMTADGIARLFREMRREGCRKIACCAVKPHMYEPGFPTLAGYDYERRLSGEQQRQVIELAWDCGNDAFRQIRMEYEKQPFDGIFIPHFLLEQSSDIYRDTGLPGSVRISSANLAHAAQGNGTSFNMEYPYAEILEQAVQNLLGKHFNPVNQSFRCQLHDLRSGKYSDESTKEKVKS